MLCLLRPLYTISTVRTLSSTNHNAVHKSHDIKQPIADEQSVEQEPKKGFLETKEDFFTSANERTDHRSHVATPTNHSTEHRSHDIKQGKSKNLKMPIIIPSDRRMPINMMAEIQDYISDMSSDRKKYLREVSSSKTSIAANLRPRIDVKEEGLTERFKAIDVLLERDKKKEEEDEIKRTPMSGSLASDVKFLSHLPSLYHLSNAVITEIKKRDPKFTPCTMLDVGGNMGSTIWAVNNYYSETMMDYVWHEQNKYEQYLGIRLFGKYSPHIPNIIRKGRYSLPRNGDYDIITAVNHFSSLLTHEMAPRLKHLWSMTNTYLVIAENTTQYSSTIMSNLRSQFCDRLEGGHIFAPCPHMSTCPLVASNLNKPCQTILMTENEMQAFTPKNLLQANLNHQKVKFSYLILKKGEKKGKHFSRLLYAPNQKLKKDGKKTKMEFTTCNSDGTMSMNEMNRKDAINLWKHLQYKNEGALISANWVNYPTRFRSLAWHTVEKKKSSEKKKTVSKDHLEEIDEEEDAMLDFGAEETKYSTSKDGKHAEELFEKFAGSMNEAQNYGRSDEMFDESDEMFDESDEMFDESDEMFDDHLDQLDIIEKST